MDCEGWLATESMPLFDNCEGSNSTEAMRSQLIDAFVEETYCQRVDAPWGRVIPQGRDSLVD
jgi:hypothetical protein